jgi:hypothetical protein
VRRGELRGYTRPSTPDQVRTVVILSSDGINDSPRPWLLEIELRDRDPGDLLAIPVADRGWAYAGDLSRLYPRLDRPAAGSDRHDHVGATGRGVARRPGSLTLAAA